MCTCIDKLEKALVKKTGDPRAMMVTAVLFDFGARKAVRRPQPLEVRYRKKKKDGSLRMQQAKSYIHFNHCPFCGKKYS